MRTHASQCDRAVHAQGGFTLVELLVALLIGLFLIGGLLTIVQDNKRSFSTQNQLAQLQDGERLAMTMATDVDPGNGLFPRSDGQYPGLAAAAAGALAQGQTITGTYSAAAPGDSITVRYVTNSGDGILNCSGSSNTSGAIATYTNTFSVVVNAAA